jgi:serine/threonine-protein kinase HipA
MSPRERLVPLDVYLGTDHVGMLEGLGPPRVRFTYDQGTRGRFADGTPLLSASLPLREERYPNAECKPFFEGLLPEGVIRDQVANQLHVGRDSTYHLLAALGADCAGAVVLLPEGSDVSAEADIVWLTEDELAERIERLPRAPLGIDPEEGIRLSLAGAQDKLIVVRTQGGRFGQPRGGTPSTHIIKPNPDRYPQLVENELFCLRVAQCVGLRTAHAERIEIAGRTSLLVERFDRSLSGGGQMVRVHQEDFCQALGVLPTQKYEDDGGPSVRQSIELIRAVSSLAAADTLQFIDSLVLNFVIGNSDSHGKNFALVYEPLGAPRLAPLYDLVSTGVYEGLTTALAMTIGGARDPADVTLASWDELAAEAGLGRLSARVRETTGRIVVCVAAQLEAARAEGWHVSLLDEIADVVTSRAEQLGIVAAAPS